MGRKIASKSLVDEPERVKPFSASRAPKPIRSDTITTPEWVNSNERRWVHSDERQSQPVVAQHDLAMR